jgi:two-component system cell cycle sensor histidine kinase/response regulator CckA
LTVPSSLAGSVDLAMFQAAVDTARDAVVWADGEGRIVYVNQRAADWLGYGRDELCALPIWDVDAGADRESWPIIWRSPLEALRESTYVRKDGTRVPVEVSARDLDVAGRRLRVAFVRDITAERAVTTALRRTQAAVDRAPDPIFWVRADGTFAYVNEAACATLEYSRDELMRLKVPDISPQGGAWEDRWRAHRQERPRLFERVHRTKSGREFPVEISISSMSFEGEQYNCVYARDVSDRLHADQERARLEMQLLHAQKLESVGRLAGGVAHDFNNMLAVILGYAELITNGLAATDPLQGPLGEIKKAASHARDTTRQLLAFSRKQVIMPKAVDVNALVEGARNSLMRLIGEDIALSFAPGNKLWQVAFDPSQLEQMLVNLIVNARDALPHGGRIAIETANATLDEAACRGVGELKPGDYVLLTVRDDGVGMDAETLSHIFEPFFSTKEVGKGTGLGLATVYGAIKQNEGHVEVSSTVGSGTTFRLYIPRLSGEVPAAGAGDEAPAARGEGTILLVEDDTMVREMTRSMLETLGYTVLPASSARAALALCEEPGRRIDLLFTDVVMPDMKGPELRERVRALRPGLEVLFMSGHAPSLLGASAGETVRFLKKPFSLAELARTVASALAQPR